MPTRRKRPPKQLSLLTKRQLDALKQTQGGNPNPMVVALGFGQKGKRCGTCAYCIRTRPKHFKCRWITLDGGAQTDIRARWDACAQYKSVPPETTDNTEEPNADQ